jgi:hypothetical protein
MDCESGNGSGKTGNGSGRLRITIQDYGVRSTNSKSRIANHGHQLNHICVQPIRITTKDSTRGATATKMGRVPVEDLSQGMELERPITNRNGLAMLGVGTQLTGQLIDRIKDLGVSSVYIRGMGRALIPEDEALAAFEDRFADAGSAPYVNMVKGAMKEHIEGLYGAHGRTDGQE